MDIATLVLGEGGYPKRLKRLRHPPKQLYCLGANLNQLLQLPAVAIVGSRVVSPYGRQVSYDLARKLAEQGVVIISGLAMGVDSLAHEAALEAGGSTIAVLPSPVDDVYPAINRPLARQILEAGGILVSEYASHNYAFKSNFVARNRIVAGLAHTVVITEAAKGSGSLHTARFAHGLEKPVFAVPGPITNPQSFSTNNLLKSFAQPVTSATDILKLLKLEPHKTKLPRVVGRNLAEQTLLDLMLKGVKDADELLTRSKLSVSDFNQTLVTLEISGTIRSLGANQWAIN